MTRRRLFLGAALIGAALVTLALITIGRSDGDGFRFPENASKIYRWSMKTRFSALSGPAQREISMTGRLNLRVLKSEKPSLALQLTDLEVRLGGTPSPELREAYSRPFVIEVDARGRFGQSYFPEDLATSDRAALDATVRALAITLPAQETTAWEEQESDKNGRYLAAYRLEEGVIVKRKRRYTAPQASAGTPVQGVSIQVLSSRARAVVDRQGPWLERCEGRERLKLRTQDGQLLTSSDTRFSLEPAEGLPAPELMIMRDAEVRSLQSPRDAPSRAMSVWEHLRRERQRQGFLRDGVTLESLLPALTRGSPEGMHRLAAFLRAFPDQTPRFAEKLPGLLGLGAARLIHGLQLAGSAEAQRILAQIMESDQHTPDNRRRALISMMSLERPEPELGERLLRFRAATRGAADGPEKKLSVASLLSLGALVPRMEPGMRDRILDELKRELAAASQPSEQRNCLLALKNARHPLPLERIREQLASPSPGVRAAAVGLAALDQAEGPRELITLLEREREPSVRRAILSAFLEQPPRTETNAAVTRALTSRRDSLAAVRSKLVAYLVRHLEAFPQNRGTLEQALRTETDRRISATILTALSRNKASIKIH